MKSPELKSAVKPRLREKRACQLRDLIGSAQLLPRFAQPGIDALQQALYSRQLEHDRSLVIHSDRGWRYVSIRYTDRLAGTSIELWVGSKGDFYDNALAETFNNLYNVG